MKKSITTSNVNVPALTELRPEELQSVEGGFRRCFRIPFTHKRICVTIRLPRLPRLPLPFPL